MGSSGMHFGWFSPYKHSLPLMQSCDRIRTKLSVQCHRNYFTYTNPIYMTTTFEIHSGGASRLCIIVYDPKHCAHGEVIVTDLIQLYNGMKCDNISDVLHASGVWNAGMQYGNVFSSFDVERAFMKMDSNGNDEISYSDVVMAVKEDESIRNLFMRSTALKALLTETLWSDTKYGFQSVNAPISIQNLMIWWEAELKQQKQIVIRKLFCKLQAQVQRSGRNTPPFLHLNICMK